MPRKTDPESARRRHETQRAAIKAYADRASIAGRDIGEIPACVNPERREACRYNLKLFLQTYFPLQFYLPFSADHDSVVQRAQITALKGGQYAIEMPRGSGKTRIVEGVHIWCLVYAHHRCGAIIGATAEKAAAILDSIKKEFENNQLLLEDFPEICYPIHKLEGIPRRAQGQLYQGKLTKIEWAANSLVLPTIEGSPASGGTLVVSGITGAGRGVFHKLETGEVLRPTIYSADDPQTDESANSLTQSATRYRLICNLKGLAGPGGTPPALFVPCTCICDGDTTTMLRKDVSFRHSHHKICDKLPDNLKLWDKYWEIRVEEIANDETGELRQSTEFYRQNQAEMDAGCTPNWRERFNTNEISAIQYLMNLYLANPETFFAEYMNEPKHRGQGEDKITEELIGKKLSGLKRRQVPDYCDRLTAFIDVHTTVLVWGVMALSGRFAGSLIDYGYWPDNDGVLPIQLSQCRRQIGNSLAGDHSPEALLYNALDECLDHMLAQQYERDDGALLDIKQVMVDANYGTMTDLCYQWAGDANRKHGGIVLPSHGKGYGARSQLWSMLKHKAGDTHGTRWNITKAEKRSIRHVVFDTNYWKSFAAARLQSGKGDDGALTIFGNKIFEHNTLVNHLTAEESALVTVNGKTVEEWASKPNRTENHLWDVLVGCQVAGSISGCKLAKSGHEPVSEKRRRVAAPMK